MLNQPNFLMMSRLSKTAAGGPVIFLHLKKKEYSFSGNQKKTYQFSKIF